MRLEKKTPRLQRYAEAPTPYSAMFYIYIFRINILGPHRPIGFFKTNENKIFYRIRAKNIDWISPAKEASPELGRQSR
jgi:hypothetical protein